MGDILNVGTNQSCINQQESWIDTSMFLQKDNYLGEFSNEVPSEDGGTIDEKALARLNLEVYSKAESDASSSQYTDNAINDHSNADDPHKDRAYTDSRIQDTSSNFNNQLTDLRNNLERLINNVQNILTRDYATVNQLNGITNQLNNFVKKDGSIPFTKPQIGVNPTNSNHLATKGYVDRAAEPKVREYLNSEEFRTIVNTIINSIIEELFPESFSEIQETISDILLALDEIDFVTAESLNDLNSRTNKIENTLIDNELTISASLNDLNARIIETNHNLEVVNNKIKLIPNRITINGKSMEDELTQKETKFFELLFKNFDAYNLIHTFSQYASININIVSESSSEFSVTIMINNVQSIRKITYNQQDEPECTIYPVTSTDPIVNNFISIEGTTIKDFLETIDKNTYNTYFNV